MLLAGLQAPALPVMCAHVVVRDAGGTGWGAWREEVSKSGIGAHAHAGGRNSRLASEGKRASVEVLYAHLLRWLSGGCLSSQATANPLIPWDMKAAICIGHSYR